MSKACKPKGKAPIPLPSNRETQTITGSNKRCFYYINSVVPLYQYMHKVLDVLKSGNYLDLS